MAQLFLRLVVFVCMTALAYLGIVVWVRSAGDEALAAFWLLVISTVGLALLALGAVGDIVRGRPPSLEETPDSPDNAEPRAGVTP